MMKRYLILYSILISNTIFGQNLVRNGGFEILKRCPDNYGQITLALGWYSIWDGGTDTDASLFNLCSTPSNFNMAIPGLRKPRSGKGYAGILAGEHQTIQTRLSRKLAKGNRYKVEFFLKSEHGSECALTPVYGLLTKYSTMDSVFKYEGFEKQVCIDDYKQLLDTSQWVKVEGIYSAKGDERYFTIAYHNIYRKLFCLCIYTIDDISVYPLDEENTFPQDIAIIDSNSYSKQANVFILKNINFEFDKSELMPESFSTLDKLVDYLVENEKFCIVIKGHTDNVGIETHNYELSTNRAKAVFEYLAMKGISKNRMTYEGFGSFKPIKDNSTKENRQFNRRVEIELK